VTPPGGLHVESRFVEGWRETSFEAMVAVEMVLSGSVNKKLAATLTAAGIPTIGISGRDGGLVREFLPGLGVGVPGTWTRLSVFFGRRYLRSSFLWRVGCSERL
jgi:acetylglutamate kinase